MKNKLESALTELGTVLVAYSGGVDSSLLMAIAHGLPGVDATAVLIDSPLISRREKKQALETAQSIGFPVHVLVVDPLSVPKIARNGRRRCYYCKRFLFQKLADLAVKRGIPHMIHGANVDDLGDYRPGMDAAVELGFKAPFIDCSITKSQIRGMCKTLGFPVWNKPASACLASRIPYGTEISLDRLSQVEAAEAVLLELGFEGCRVRHHGQIARIEVPDTIIEKMVDPSLRKKISFGLKRVGFLYVALDLDGYSLGSLNKTS